MKNLWIIFLIIIICFTWFITMATKSKNLSNNTVILVSGLSDFGESKLIKNIWKRNGIEIIFFESKWKSDENYQTKLNRLLNLIDKKSKNNKVSLIGTSAGGSLVINAFNERKDNINKIIAVCSRLKKGEEFGFRGFIKITKKSLSFRESVLNSEENINNFSVEDKEKIMTVYPFFGDELVPKNTSMIDGSKNRIIPTGEHITSVVSSLTVFSKQLREFVFNN